MISAVRRASILSELTEGGFLSTQVLADKMGVSEGTIRRDIAELEKDGRLIRVHGGAISTAKPPTLATVEPFHSRQSRGQEAKSRIGSFAASLLKQGDIVGIDTGTTALQIAAALPRDFKGVIATPSLLVAAKLASNPGIEVLISGGPVRPGDLTCSGPQALSFFTDLYTDISFVSSGGVSAAEGLTDFYQDEIPARRAMLNRSKRSIVVANSTKLEKVAPYHVCDLEELDGLITDTPPPESLERKAKSLGMELLLA